MSGIAGSVSWHPAVRGAEMVAAMLEAAAHRGPDGRGLWSEDEVALGHLALHTTPESIREQQPFVAGNIVLVADARIDNRADLFRRLGVSRASQPGMTDPALILAAYRRWGTRCAAELIGDFAFAIWNAEERRLFAARDPMGMRAFYYHANGRRVVFATELKQLLAGADVPVKLNEPGIAAYLAGGFGPAEWTLYADILQLAPAHGLLASADGVRSWRYWDVDPERRIRYRRDTEYAEHFRDVFVEAVRSRLRSVKPVGVLLSGGMDSGSVASAAGWLLAHDAAVSVPEFRSYSWAFDELVECDERHVSRRIAAHYGFPFTDVPVDDAWPLRGYPDHGPDRDDPYFSVQQVMYDRTFARAQAAGTGLILSGDRGDEMVGDWVYDFVSLLRSFQWRALASELSEIRRHHRVGAVRAIKKQLLKPALHDLGKRFPSPLFAQPWVEPGFAKRSELSELLLVHRPVAPTRGWARQQRYERIFRFGGARLALWLERLAAKAGLAWADPWADRRIAEFVLAVPQDRVNRITEPKRLARRALAPLFPPQVLNAANKSIPVTSWNLGFRDKERRTVLSLIEGSQSARRGFVDERILLREYQEFLRTGKARNDWWWPLTLEAWLKRYWSAQ